jgi:hypothetical protein
VIAIGCEAIIHHSTLTIPTKKDQLDLWSFEKLPNAHKSDHLCKYPINDLFSPHLDTSLRNGIGHNAAKYDASNDKVTWVKDIDGALTDECMSYTVFCDRILNITSALFQSEIYFYTLLQAMDGRLK